MFVHDVGRLFADHDGEGVGGDGGYARCAGYNEARWRCAEVSRGDGPRKDALRVNTGRECAPAYAKQRLIGHDDDVRERCLRGAA